MCTRALWGYTGAKERLKEMQELMRVLVSEAKARDEVAVEAEG